MARVRSLLSLAIICSILISQSRGQDEGEKEKKDNGEKATLEHMKKIKCLYQNIVTCGISDDKTPCQKHTWVKDEEDEDDELYFTDLYFTFGQSLEELMTKDKDGELGFFGLKTDAEDAIRRLKELQPKAKKMCSMALGLHCVNEKCGYCEGDEHHELIEDIHNATDWKEDFKCDDLGREYQKCPVSSKLSEKSTVEDLRPLKCLYKKIIKCGLTEADKPKKCEHHDLSDFLLNTLKSQAGLSLEEMLVNDAFDSKCKVEAALHDLKDYEEKTNAKQMCSISRELYCTPEHECQPLTPEKCKDTAFTNGSYCTYAKLISKATDWSQDYNCGDMEKCDSNGIPDVPSHETLKKIKCLYKKMITCGVNDTSTECIPHSEDFVHMVRNISKVSVKQLGETVYDTQEAANEAVEWLQSFENETSKMCVLSSGLLCYNNTCDRSCKSPTDPEYECYKNKSEEEDWEGLDCGDIAKCPTTNGPSKKDSSSKGVRLEMVNVIGTLTVAAFFTLWIVCGFSAD